MDGLRLSFSCTEDPRKMAPCAEGFFCQACAKPVVDLTTRSRADAVRYLEQRPGTCVRLLSEQLDPSLVPVKDLFAPLRKGSFAALAATALSMGAQAQAPAEPAPTEQAPAVDPRPQEPRRRTDVHGRSIELRDGAWVCPVPAGTAPQVRHDHYRRKCLYVTRRFPFVVFRRKALMGVPTF
ncbi:MAG: hypothetical protein JST66_12780 [Bacteroidetes bacterium]|nr:hypothetical protein [Bacteroidota bacterium]